MRAGELSASTVLLWAMSGCNGLLNIPDGYLTDAGAMDASRVVVDSGGPEALAVEAGVDAESSDGISPEAAKDAGLGPGCSPEAAHVYALGGAPPVLYTVDPPALTATPLLELRCDPSQFPSSMAVARDGFIWIVYNDGHLYRLNPEDNSCTKTSFVPGQQSFDMKLGIAFSINARGGATDTLYACAGQGLAIIDPVSLSLTPVGSIPGFDTSYGCSLVGTPDGGLFAMVSGAQGITVAQLDKATSVPISTKTVSPPVPTIGVGYGLAAWGDDLLVFAEDQQQNGEYGAWRYRTSDQSVDQVSQNIGMDVLMSAQSTCAP